MSLSEIRRYLTKASLRRRPKIWIWASEMPAEAAAEAPPMRNEWVEGEKVGKHERRMADSLGRVRKDPSENEHSGLGDRLEERDGHDAWSCWKHETGQDLLNVRASRIVAPALNGSVFDFLMNICTTPW